jgi:hypothetical protein
VMRPFALPFPGLAGLRDVLPLVFFSSWSACCFLIFDIPELRRQYRLAQHSTAQAGATTRLDLWAYFLFTRIRDDDYALERRKDTQDKTQICVPGCEASISKLPRLLCRYDGLELGAFL